MAEKQLLSSSSSNSSDTEETCLQHVLKMEAESPTCKAGEPLHDNGAAARVPMAESQGESAAAAHELTEGLESLLQKQRRDLMLELEKLQHAHRPVTSTESRDTLEEFFSGEGAERQTPSRPESILSEVRGLSEQRPVSSVLRSNAFRRNLEDMIRGTLVRQDRELQQTIRLRSAGFNMGNSRPAAAQPSADSFQQHMENLSQLSHSSRTSSNSHPSVGLADALLPPAVPQPIPYQPQQQPQQQFPSMQPFPTSQWRPQQPQIPYQQQPWQQQQYPQLQQQPQPWQQQPWQQQQQPWQQQQQSWQQQWQQPVQPQQPWQLQSSAQQPSSNVNMVAYLQQENREEAVVEISDLVQRQLVSSMLQSDFRGTLENTMMNHLQNTEADGLSVQNFIQSLPLDPTYQRNDFSHLGVRAPSRGQSTAGLAARPAMLQAGPELETLRRQMEEMQTMMRLTFDLQLDMQRSIRQEVAAALTGQHGQVPGAQSVPAPMPPSQPASEGHCVICLEKSVDAVLYQCGHMCCCLACGLRLKQMGSHCPMCRAPIRDVIRAYRCHRE